MNGVVLAAIVGGAAAIGGSLLTWLSSRRVSRGKIGTSEAAILWEQAQLMRTELVAARDKAEQQRDRLIESQATQVLPALAHISDALDSISRTLTSNTARLDRIVEHVIPGGSGGQRTGSAASGGGEGPDH